VLDGVDIIYIAPPVILAVVVVLIGIWQFGKHGIKRAIIAAVRAVFWGGLILVVLFVIWVMLYYAGGGH
jgi:hypothetical protein